MPESNEELDLAKVQEFIKGQVETYAREIFDKQPAPQPQSVTNSDQEEAARRQLQEVLTPFIQPGLSAVQLSVADVKDEASFYRSFDGNDEEKVEIEKMFEQLKTAGRPLPRQDIKDYLDGKLARQNPDDFIKKTSERRKKQIDNVGSAVDFGIGALDRAKADPVYSKDALAKMPLDELAKALEGVTF